MQGHNGAVPPIVDRYAPSPTSSLHLGNLRTALAGWLLTRSQGGRWLMRVEDLDADRVRAAGGVEREQLEDLQSLGLAWDGPAVRQSDRYEAYRAALSSLAGRTYECFCSRRELAEASSAPHGDGHRAYPGTCARLGTAEAARRHEIRPGAIRVRAEGAGFTVLDLHAGAVTGLVDDFVLMRADGAFSYNFATTVDDVSQGVTRITRGADLLSSAPRQAWLATQLGGRAPTYTHVGLVTNEQGARLAKRDGSVTLADLVRAGWDVGDVLATLTESLGIGRHRSALEALECMPEDGLPARDSRFWGGAAWHDATGRLITA